MNLHTTQRVRLGLNFMLVAVILCTKLLATIIPATDKQLLNGLSPYNWVCKEDSISSSVNGAAITLHFKGTQQVIMHVATDHLESKIPSHFPVIAWSVNGGMAQTYQLLADTNDVLLSTGLNDPNIEIYLKGTSPFEDRFDGDVPGNSLKITGFEVDAAGSLTSSNVSSKIWLNIGDSIMSGDGAIYTKGQGRPPDDGWAASEDGRASYGYLLAKHYGYQEARLAYGGYNWAGGMAGMPALETLIDQRTSTVSRLLEGKLSPLPEVVLVNLGENGKPEAAAVVQALTKLRSRVSMATKILVMIPASGKGRDELMQAFKSYQIATNDTNAELVDIGPVSFDTCDGVHPTADGHQSIYQAALPFFDKIVVMNHLTTAIELNHLRCEYQENPIGIDVAKPRLSWQMGEISGKATTRGQRQTAFQVIVASTEEKLKLDHGDLWDSGKVISNQTIQIEYAGQPLVSQTQCHWKVRVWDKDEVATEWSRPATWEMGLLSPQEWHAQWINDGKPTPTKPEDFYQEDPAPLFRKPFNLPEKILRARLFISGLGYYQASLNGKIIGDQVLDPGWTGYSKSVLYSTYEVTSQLRRGDNCLGVTLGNGWYNPLPLRFWGHLNLREHLTTGRPRFIARLEVEFCDGSKQSIVSDTSWKVSDGPIRFNNIYLGEKYDARREVLGWDGPGFLDSAWRQPAAASEPIGVLRAQAQPPIKVTRILKPVKITEPTPGVYLFDMGQNFSGWVKLQVSAPAGTEMILRYGELLNKDGSLNPLTSVAGQIKGRRKNSAGVEESVGGPGAPDMAWQSDTYITKGQGIEEYTPRFTFHAFRYVEVKGLIEKPSEEVITGLRLNSDVESAGSFRCSNTDFNRIQEMCDWTFLSNIFSVQSDCPHRERFGYGGDLAVTSEAFMMNYQMPSFYAKTVRDWGDSARADGTLTDTAPAIGVEYCGLAWGMAHPLLQRQLYQYYGERRLLEEQYATSKRWLDLEVGKNPQLIVVDGLSDHESLVPTPAPVMVTPLFATSAKIVSELAGILGHLEDKEKYRSLATHIQKVYSDKFIDPITGKVGHGTQASQAFALYLDLVPKEQRQAVLDYLMTDLRHSHTPHLTTGIFGTKFMLEVLSRENHSDLASAMVSQKSSPGWGQMLEQGATTLWEHWEGSDNTYSQNHPMFGSVSQWFYQWLGGIQPAPDAVGFDHIIIRPQIPAGLDWARCHYDSVRGRIVSRWQRSGNMLTLEITIPMNSTATLYIPTRDASGVTESGKRTDEAGGVKFLRMENNAAVYAVGSGTFQFLSQVP
jgi:alpha-L-rhamnosidase